MTSPDRASAGDRIDADLLPSFEWRHASFETVFREWIISTERRLREITTYTRLGSYLRWIQSTREKGKKGPEIRSSARSRPWFAIRRPLPHGIAARLRVYVVRMRAMLHASRVRRAIDDVIRAESSGAHSPELSRECVNPARAFGEVSYHVRGSQFRTASRERLCQSRASSRSLTRGDASLPRDRTAFSFRAHVSTSCTC